MQSSKITQKTSESKTKPLRSTSKKKSSSQTEATIAPSFREEVLGEIQDSPQPPDSAFENDAPKGLIDYEVRYIAFVDILGFKDFVHNNRTESDVSLIISALDVRPIIRPVVINEVCDAEKDVDLRIHTFSDFVVASTCVSPAGLAALVFIMWELSTRWLSNRFLCRGGITRGQVVHRAGQDGNAPMVFGPAFTEAYQIESVIADYPRIVLSKLVRDDWRSYNQSTKLGSKLPLLVHRCDDGPHCIDLFCHLRNFGFDIVASEVPVEAAQMRDALVLHLDANAERPAVYRKAFWIAEKFNEAIKDSKYGHLKIRQSD